MADTPETMRIDRFLWFARLAKTRGIAQALAEGGMLHLDGHRIERAHSPVRPGSVLTFAQGPRVRVIRIERLPHRRGPAPEAATLYTELTQSSANPVDEAGPAA